jgi:hypothetical protein
MESITTPSPVTKILSVANKLAPIAGVLHGFLGDPMGDGRGIAGVPTFIFQRLTNAQAPEGGGCPSPGLLQGHIGNPLVTTKIALTMPDKYPIMSGAAAALVGWLAEKVGPAIDAGMPGQIITGFGRFFKNYGVAACGSAVMAGWLFLSPFNPTGGTQHTAATGYTGGVQYRTQGPGSTNTFWQVRAAANIRESTGPVDIYPT